MHKNNFSIGLPFKVGNKNKADTPLSKFWNSFLIIYKVSKILREGIELKSLPTLKGRPNDTKNNQSL